MDNKLERLEALIKEKEKTHLCIQKFDDLDFEVFNKQKWEDIGHSHVDDVICHWPDGRTTYGIEQHVEDLKSFYIATPNIRVTSHPVKFGGDDYTCVIGEIEGTFSRPMPIGPNQYIEPTGKSMKLQMASIGRWNSEGRIVEEWIFFDNDAYLKQLGIR